MFTDGAVSRPLFRSRITILDGRSTQCPEFPPRTIKKETRTSEPGVTVVAPAIANAIFNAVGARVRSLPIKAEAVKAAIKT